ncbi:methyltransferase domain-containing protein [bacterium]|nr:methyltransferase domain-containing protein [bacterium]
MKTAIHLAENGYLPKWLVAIGIRRLVAERIHMHANETCEERKHNKQKLVEELKQSTIAIHTEKANEQHYEVPAGFFQAVLGKHLKYSSGYWPEGVDTLDEAETRMLQLYGERAELRDGMDILELGCGWGSLSLWMAENYPNASIQAISNSHSQRKLIEDQCRKRGIENLTIHTADINHFSTSSTFDRVVSIEMFEHLRNYRELFARIASWLKPDGKLFTHIFSHRDLAYYYETEGAKNWMGQYFFTGGIMPSDDLFSYFPDDMQIEQQWRLDGTHYQKTALAWLHNMQANRRIVLETLAATYGEAEKHLWFHRWKLFFMACAELFGYDKGQEWGVSHYRLNKVNP